MTDRKPPSNRTVLSCMPVAAMAVVTAILAEIGTDDEVVFLNCGHPAPMVVRHYGTVSFPQPPAHALPLGLAAHGSEGPKPYRVDFAPGEQLLLCADGVTEARDDAAMLLLRYHGHGEGKSAPIG